MNEFYGGIVAGVAILGGFCAFMYWVFALMEKRQDEKLERMAADVHSLAMDIKEERRNQAHLYQFVLDSTKKGG
jgi:hypothetical protein